MITRKEYMKLYSEAFSVEDRSNSEKVHRVYMAQMVTPKIKDIVLRSIGLGELLASEDHYFNDIPLHRWDALARHTYSRRMELIDGHCTLATGVCVLKEAARQLVEEAHEQL